MVHVRAYIYRYRCVPQSEGRRRRAVDPDGGVEVSYSAAMNSSEPLPTTTSTPTVDELKEALSDAADDVATQPVNVNGESVQFVNVAEPVPPGMSSYVTDQLIS